MDQKMTRFFIALAAVATTTAPLLALSSPFVAAKPKSAAIIGSDYPILLKRMVVSATVLPDV